MEAVRIAALLGAVFLVIFATADAASAGRNPARPVAPPKANTLTSKDSKRKAMEHPAFETAGQQKGIEVWRIEDFNPVLVPKGEVGKFYSGDSYIILNTKEDKNNRKSWDLHFWLGSKTTQDESGTAAILTVGLDEKLGGAPVQHREVQGHESPTFLAYFKPAIRYLDGGHASGFTHVTTNAGAEKRMFQVKGKKNIRVRQVEPSVASMNKGDCFILDVEHDIYVYVGPTAKRVEKLKAISAANQIRDQDHSGRSKIQIIDDFSSGSDFDHFFEALGSGSKDSVPEEHAGGDDQTFERTEEQTVSLYRISDESGKMEAKPVAKPFKQDDLNENDCYVLDTVTGGIYVWVGKQCNAKERTEVMTKAQQYLESKKYPSWVHVTRVPQGTEPATFKQYFTTWRDHGASHTRLIRAVSDEEMYSSDADVSAAKIRKVVKSGSARGFMPDKGDGHTIVYRVEDMELVEVADSEDPDRSDENGAKFGQFYQGDSYVVKYEYNCAEGTTRHILYYWLGKDSTIDEKAAAAMQTVALSNQLGGHIIQVRIPQGEETKHFLKIFKGHLVTHLGGHGSGFRGLNEKDSYDTDGIRLFKVEGGEKEGDLRAEQVSELSSSLDSNNCFLLETPDQMFAWIGKESSDDEKEGVESFSKILFSDREITTLEEGEETDEFWDALGGAPEEIQDSSAAAQKKMKLRLGMEPRLIHIIVDWRNQVKLEEIGDFAQEDLDDDDAFLLDSGEEIYAWVGNQASSKERQSIQTAISDHLSTDPSERTPDSVVVIHVKQGHEPRIFKRMFEEWDDHMWSNQISYDDMKTRALELNEV